MTNPSPPFTKRMNTDSLMDVCDEVRIDYSLSNMNDGRRGFYAVVSYLYKPHMSRHFFVEAEGKSPSDALFLAMSQAWERMDHSFDRVARKGRKAAKISKEELQELIDTAIKEYGSHIHTLTCLTPRVENDIGVQFDTENEEFDRPENWKPWEDLLGYRQWGDLTFLGGMSGGDWETPVFWIIYYDGQELRSYVPKDGNVWNYETHQAIGNDEKADIEHARKVGWTNADKIFIAQHDVDKIRQDVLSRIKVT